MAVTAASVTEYRNLEQALQENIDQRTARRLRHLEVTRIGNQLTIRAEAPSFYVKQLALTSILKPLRPTSSAMNVIASVLTAP